MGRGDNPKEFTRGEAGELNNLKARDSNRDRSLNGRSVLGHGARCIFRSRSGLVPRQRLNFLDRHGDQPGQPHIGAADARRCLI